MKTGKSEYETAEIEARVMDHIEELLERMILDTIHGIFCRLSEKIKNLPPTVCYKDDCHKRDNIPF